MPLELAVAIPTFVCSLLSFLATSTFAVCYFLFPPEWHFRQALIVNLLVSDWINSLNNSVSGAIAIQRRNDNEPLADGPQCTANGYIGQWSVQATDFNILIISLVVLLTVTRSQLTYAPPWWQVAIVCAMPWIPGAITSNLALGLGLYGPVSGNWCWIKPDLLDRYMLAHGWRWLIFAVTIGIYTFIYIYLKRTYGKLFLSSGGNSAPGTGMSWTCKGTVGEGTVNDVGLINAENPFSHSIDIRTSIVVKFEDGAGVGPRDEMPPLHEIPFDEIEKKPSEEVESNRSETSSFHEGRSSNGATSSTQEFTYHTPAPFHLTQATPAPPLGRMRSVSVSSNMKRERALRKMLLLNGYPLLYIMLWLPGMANRVAEIVGVSPKWLRIFQCTTQLVGFANSLTYAWNESLFDRVKSRWRFSRRQGRTAFALPTRRGTEAMV